jgi:hypothetical protein
MSSDEQVRAALRRPQRPAPDEAGAYERFLRRRAFRRRRVQVGVAISAVLLLLGGVVAVRLLPVGSAVPPVAPPSTAPSRVTLSLRQLQQQDPGLLLNFADRPGDVFRPTGPAALIRGVHQGFRWQFIVVMGVDRHGQRLGLCYLREDRPGSAVGGGTCGWSRNPAERAPPWLDDTGRAGIFEYWGAAPKATARVRLEPVGGRRPVRPVVVDAIDPGPAFPFRVYVGFAPPQLGPVRAVALDASGRELARSRDPLSLPFGLAPTDTPVLVTTQTSAAGTRKLYAYHAHQDSCIRLVDVDGREEGGDCYPPDAKGHHRPYRDPQALHRHRHYLWRAAPGSPDGSLHRRERTADPGAGLRRRRALRPRLLSGRDPLRPSG